MAFFPSARPALILVFLLAAVRLPADPVQGKHARVELIARENTVTPGGQLLLGVHFILEPGWHIYWVNPGDSGQPPSFQWQLPPGFVAGDIQWPRPERMQSSPDLADYGYHDEILLMVPVRVPKSANSDGKIALTADAKWLICREICIPDHAQLHVSLPAGPAKEENPATAPIFAATEKLLPKPLPPWKMAFAVSQQDSFVIHLETRSLTGAPQFFPLEPGQVDNASLPSLEPRPPGLRSLAIKLKKSDLLLKPIKVLRGVLVLPGDGIYRVEIPVTPAKE